MILASKSPRRKELLSMLGLEFTVAAADIDETMPRGMPTEKAMAAVCKRKAAAVAASYPGELIIAADTIVVLGEVILGKPKTKEEAANMLRALSGNTHMVLTACCLWKDGITRTFVEKTNVRFRQLSYREIDAYIATGSPMDKAGAYGIQDQAAIFVEALEGDYYNVMGLPLCRLSEELLRMGVTILG